MHEGSLHGMAIEGVVAELEIRLFDLISGVWIGETQGSTVSS